MTAISQENQVESHHHFKMFKPWGCVSQFKPRPKKSKTLLGDFFDFPEETMAIGRLDMDSEGLLLLTTDGMVSYKVRDKSIEKEYYVQVDGEITDEAIQNLQSGVEISTNGSIYKTLPCKAYKLEDEPKLPPRARNIRKSKHGPTSWVSITITEGKFRQVRKMTAAIGFPTLRLVRVRIGNIHLGNLLPEDVIELDNLDEALT
ncbi:pseudouridine synthase [Halarcobacter bivalviorum]|uniref:Pseudouridine synthase n=1 Tax=Halarcobacter bivalviorum TaxID=663364 RepID=A0AAX2A9L4_9BACT|nr:pseudouridine synthase [Halarcobacter bivalviorum]AXH12570.1 23S rRNA pseudouridine 2457 synthase [Halarcobacter bivalviorum]RXK10505.1 pseudouridine synthase [Halarcobacter bivalviorum]